MQTFGGWEVGEEEGIRGRRIEAVECIIEYDSLARRLDRVFEDIDLCSTGLCPWPPSLAFVA